MSAQRRRPWRPGRAALWALAGLGFAFLLGPVLIIIVVSFSGAEYLRFPPPTFSLRWYDRFFGGREWRAAIWVSVQVAVLATLIATSVGTLASLGLVRGRFRGKGVAYALLLSPMIVPTIITAIALYFLFAGLGAIGSVLAMALGHTVLSLPVVVIIVSASLQGFDGRLEQAALSLGASPFVAVRRVTLPLIAPAVVSAALFAFLGSFDDLLIPLFLARIGSETLTVRIWNSLHLEVDPTIAAVSAVLIGVTAAVVGTSGLLRVRGDGRAPAPPRAEV